jgi:uncharacterized membrane protein
VIYTVYRPTCHQLPERSFFLAGYKVAVCARCSALYVSFWSVGVLYGLARWIWPQRAPVWPAQALKWVLIASAPLIVDGLTQLVGLHESTNVLRTVTGVLCGGAAAWFIYPNLHIGFQDASGEHARNRNWVVPREQGDDLWVR